MRVEKPGFIYLFKKNLGIPPAYCTAIPEGLLQVAPGHGTTLWSTALDQDQVKQRTATLLFFTCPQYIMVTIAQSLGHTLCEVGWPT